MDKHIVDETEVARLHFRCLLRELAGWSFQPQRTSQPSLDPMKDNYPQMIDRERAPKETIDRGDLLPDS